MNILVKKTKKYILHKYNKHNSSKTSNKFKTNDKLHLHILKNNIVLRSPHSIKSNSLTQHTKIINYIDGVDDILQMTILKNKFKTFFTIDYMNYINLDIDKRQSNISKKFLKYDKEPIIIEGYLAITISSGVLYESYMLDTLKIINVSSKFSPPSKLKKYTSKQVQTLYFPQDLPASFISKENAYEIMNQVYTIIKYIAIILAYQKLSIRYCYNKNNCNPNNISAFEIIKIQMRVYDDFTMILDNCKIKKEWRDSYDDNIIINWLNQIFFKKKLSTQKHITRMKTHKSIQNKVRENYNSLQVLYKLDLSDKQKIIKTPAIYASSMSRSDFNNKFIIISSDFIKKDFTKVDVDFAEYIKYLKKYGLQFEDFYSSIGTKPAFIFYPYDAPANKHLITQHYSTPAYCANMLDSLDNINNKSNLFFYLKKLYPNEYRNFIADSFLLSHTTKYTQGNIYIARPVNHIDPKTGKIKITAFAGRDIIYITNPDSLAAAKRLLDRYDNVLISDYITNPLLFRGRKFHLRVYLLITYINSKVKTYFFPDSYIWTAAKPFVLDKFHDKGIHDTHYTSTDDDYLFSSDFNTENMGRIITKEMKTKLLEDMQVIMDKISHVLVYGKTGVKLFSNHKNGFQIEGIDIMINDNMQPILIECNDKAGISDRSGKGIEMQKRFISIINEHVFEPLFGK